MSVGFGFSIGDLIGVGNLALQIVQALSESKGAKADYQSLCELLLSLHNSIQSAATVFLQACVASNEGSLLDIAPLNGIRHELGCCKRLMDKFMTSAVKYTEAFSNVGRWRLSSQCRKVMWFLYKVDDVRKLQTDLQGHFGAFQLYTSALIRQSLARTEQKVTEGTEINHRIFVGVMEMIALLKTLQDDIPKNIGYPWEGGWSEDQKPIHFEDALGRVVMLPILLCSTRDSFHGVLKIMFKDLPGQERIAQEEYEITEDSEGIIIQDPIWQSKVSPGARIAMSILIRTLSASVSGAVNNCPRCRKPHIGAKPEKTELRCRFCNLIFRNFDVERIVELPDIPQTEENLTISQIAKDNKQERKGPREEDAFRRIHYYWETMKWNYPESDGDSSDWESPTDEISFKNLGSKPQQTSRHSLLSAMLQEPECAAVLTPKQTTEGPLPVPIIMTTSNLHPTALSPRTTRRNMLATELTESLRRHLLWERSEKESRVGPLLKRRNSAHNIAAQDATKLGNFPQVNSYSGKGTTVTYGFDVPDETNMRSKGDLSKSNPWSHYLDINLDKYHAAGW